MLFAKYVLFFVLFLKGILTVLALCSTCNWVQWVSESSVNRKHSTENKALDDYSNQPNSVVEDVGFCCIIWPGAALYASSCKQILFRCCHTQALFQTVNTHIDHIRKNTATSLSITSNTWSSTITPMSILGLIAQWIDLMEIHCTAMCLWHFVWEEKKQTCCYFVWKWTCYCIFSENNILRINWSW